MGVNERRQRAAQEAAEWWVLLQSQELPHRQRAELVDWLRESSLHVDEMLRMAQVHGALEAFKGWDRIATQETGVSASGSGTVDNVARLPLRVPAAPAAAHRPRSGSSPGRLIGFGIAVATAAAFGLAVWLLVPGGYMVETVQGERRAITLPEGSVVKVDPQTRLRIEFGTRLRQIDVQRGRARFRVAKDPMRPFLVEADDTVVRAVGTEFGVEHREQGIVVTVAEGRVSVLRAAQSGRTLPARGKPAADEAQVMVSTGQQVTVTRGGAVGAVHRVDAEKELSWADGRLTFENERIDAVVAAFNRYNRLQMHVLDPRLAERKLSGVFDASDPESFIAFLQSVTAVSVARDSREIMIGSGP